MQTARLFELIEQSKLYDLREEMEEKDELGFGKTVCELREKLFSGLNDEQKEIAEKLEVAIENKLDELHYGLEVFLVNYTFRMGMEMQRVFDEEDFK